MASFTINAILGHSPPNYNKANDSVPRDEAYETTTDITEAGLCLSLTLFRSSSRKNRRCCLACF